MTWEQANISDMTREEAYQLSESILRNMLHEDSGIELDEIAFMSTLCSLIISMHQKVFWIGFYRVVKPNKLLIGPYQGSPGCLEIDFSRGVCGRAASEERIIIVDDVHEDPEHIACDARSRSEIVLPVFSADGTLTAVLDLDSTQVAAFDNVDAEWLVKLLELFYG